MAARTTGEVLILGIAATVCVLLLTVGVVLAVTVVSDPGRDISAGAAFMASTISTLISLMAGFLAGRTDSPEREVRGDAAVDVD